MYLRHTIRKKDGKVHRYWCLVRSVRVGRRVIQQTVAQLGELDAHGRLEARVLARQLIGTPEQALLFDDGCRDVRVPVRLKGIRLERSRQFGDVYLALALWRGIGLSQLCEDVLPAGKERVAWEKIAAVLVAARLCEPSSELHIAERSTRIASIALSISSWCTRQRWKRTCRGARESCLQSRTRFCSTTLRVRILRVRPQRTRWRSVGIRVITDPIASRY